MPALKMPKGLPKLPPVPDGYDRWISFGHYIVAVREPKKAKPKAKQSPRRESLTQRIATAIQIGKRDGAPAMDTARNVMRIFAADQRAKRRKAGAQ